MSDTCYRFVVKLDRNFGVVLEYRAGTVQDLDVLARIGADAFSDYPLFRLTEPELRPGVTFDQFHFALHRMLVKFSLSANLCWWLVKTVSLVVMRYCKSKKCLFCLTYLTAV